MNTDILVIKRDILFKDFVLDGFVHIEDKNILPIINEYSEYQLRNDALEKNLAFKQIIPYIIVINKKEKKIFGYKRFKKNAGFHETRLHNKFSIGLGGHVDKVEAKDNLIYESMMREFMEEVDMVNYPSPKVIGFINSELTEVDRMHIAIVAIADTTESVGKRENEEVVEEKFYSIDEIESIIKDDSIQIETWTKVAWPAVKNYILN